MPFSYTSMRHRLNANSREEPAPTGPVYRHFEKPCRIWTGRKGGSMGYGRISMRSRQRHQSGPRKGERMVKTYYAHRVSKAIELGIPIYRLLHCCHDCDRPACIEPTHIASKSQKKNVNDAVDRGRHRNGHTAEAA